jgi:hypothetical protein
LKYISDQFLCLIQFEKKNTTHESTMPWRRSIAKVTANRQSIAISDTSTVMTRKASKPSSCKWRIVERRSVGQGLSRTLEPAYVASDGKGSDEFPFGCVIAGLGCAAAADSVDFISVRHEMDEASGDDLAELLTDGSLTCFHNGDECTFKAPRW